MAKNKQVFLIAMLLIMLSSSLISTQVEAKLLNVTVKNEISSSLCVVYYGESKEKYHVNVLGNKGTSVSADTDYEFRIERAQFGYTGHAPCDRVTKNIELRSKFQIWPTRTGVTFRCKEGRCGMSDVYDYQPR